MNRSDGSRPGMRQNPQPRMEQPVSRQPGDPPKRRSMYDVPRSGPNGTNIRNVSGTRPVQGQTRGVPNGGRISGSANAGSGMYSVSAAQRQRLARMQAEAQKRPMQNSVPLRNAVPQSLVQRQDPKPSAPQNSSAATTAPRPEAAPTAANSTGYGTRIQSSGGNLYGNHSSYRTSDGRILEGFDKSGRPIYREPGTENANVVVRRAAFSADTLRRLHPTRRIRVETLADTEVKPFPWKLVLLVVFCTVLSMAVLYTYMELNECTNTMSTLTYRLSSLRNTYNTLSAELVQREDLIAIEETASETLGMVKNDILTKRYVSIENEDKTELVVKAAEAAKRRTSIEIDLSTGKPKKKGAQGEDAETGEPSES